MEKTVVVFAGSDVKVCCGECGKETTLAATAVENMPKPRVLELSAVPLINGARDFAHLKLEGVDHVSVGVVSAMLIATEIDRDVAAGKITPAQRPAMETLAATSIDAYRQLVATMPKQVDTTEHGTGAAGNGISELAQLEASINDLTEKHVAAGMDYAAGLKRVAIEHPELIRRRNEIIREKGRAD